MVYDFERPSFKQIKGITSVCSAHPIVLRATLRFGKLHNSPILIESTCNQVNHQGGYTNMSPKDFKDLVYSIADEENCPLELITLGGDHLGPNPWKHLSINKAMDEAEKLVESYVKAGYRKIHIDTSIPVLGDARHLDDNTVAERATRLVCIAENTARNESLPPPVYVIGTEVPTPGGADHEIKELASTTYEAALKTFQVHKELFINGGLKEAFSRVIAIVVQPGVEFGNKNIINYNQDKVKGLIGLLKKEKNLVFEAHSTDYQQSCSLNNLVKDGFAILKVGPELTFALRQSLYGLDHIASEIIPNYQYRSLYKTIERIMLANPEYWQNHYSGTEHELRILRHYSLSDRIRYYWEMDEVKSAVNKLNNALCGVNVPMTLLQQYLPNSIGFADKPLNIDELLNDCICSVLSRYYLACNNLQK